MSDIDFQNGFVCGMATRGLVKGGGGGGGASNQKILTSYSGIKVDPVDPSGLAVMGSYTVTIPANIEVEDLIVIFVVYRATLASVPEGFVLAKAQTLVSTTSPGTWLEAAVYYKAAAAGDAGKSVTFTMTDASKRILLSLVVLRATGPIVLEAAASLVSLTKTMTFPAVATSKPRSVCLCFAYNVWAGKTTKFVMTGTRWTNIEDSPGIAKDTRWCGALTFIDSQTVPAPTITTTVSPTEATLISVVFAPEHV